jgi:hypothetical protein
MTTLLLAWILWNGVTDSANRVIPDSWEPIDGFATKAECQADASALRALFDKWPVKYTCLPDTFDPRPKLACEEKAR